MNLENALKHGADVSYGPLTEIPLPPNTAASTWFAPDLVKLSGTKMKTVDKYGLFSLKSGLLADVIYKSIVLTKTDLVLLENKKGHMLMTKDGRVLAGEECDDAKDLGEGFFAKKVRKLWALFRVSDGAQLTDFSYLDISHFSEGTCAAVQKSGTMLLGMNGQPLFSNLFGYAAPYKGGFAIVGDKKQRTYIDRTGKALFTGAGPRSRDFQNGYAVIEDPKGRFGAIDTAGRVVIAPQYKFVKDAMSGMFVVSNSGAYKTDGSDFQGKDFGLVTADGSTVLPQKYGRIDARADGGYDYGNQVVWTLTEGNRRYVYAVFVSGIVNAQGQVVLPDKYVSVGEESEGLRAFKSYEDNILRFGYMREDGSTACIVATVDYGSLSDPARKLLMEDMSLQLGSFRGGEARVAVRDVEQKTGLFKNKSEIHAGKVSWYKIDTAGREITAAGTGALVTEEDLIKSPALPFASDMQEMMGSKFLTGPLKDAVCQVFPFDDLFEVNFTFGFALVDRTGNVLAGSREGMPSAMIAPQYLYTPNGSHEKYAALTRVADNVWLIAAEDGTSVHYSAFESPTRFADGLAVFRRYTGKAFLYGVMDHTGRELIPPQYTEAKLFANGCITVKKGEESAILRREKTVTERQ